MFKELGRELVYGLQTVAQEDGGLKNRKIEVDNQIIAALPKTSTKGNQVADDFIKEYDELMMLIKEVKEKVMEELEYINEEDQREFMRGVVNYGNTVSSMKERGETFEEFQSKAVKAVNSLSVETAMGILEVRRGVEEMNSKMGLVVVLMLSE